MLIHLILLRPESKNCACFFPKFHACWVRLDFQPGTKIFQHVKSSMGNDRCLKFNAFRLLKKSTNGNQYKIYVALKHVH